MSDQLSRPLIVAVLLLWLPGAAAAQAASSSRLRLPLYGAFIALQVVDVDTTLLAWDRGARELNPLIPKHAGGLVAVKVAGAVGTVWLTERLRRRHPRAALVVQIAVTSISAVVVARNVRVLATPPRTTR